MYSYGRHSLSRGGLISESCSKAICLLGIGALIMGGVFMTVLLEGWLCGSIWLLLLLKGEGTVGAASNLLSGV